MFGPPGTETLTAAPGTLTNAVSLCVLKNRVSVFVPKRDEKIQGIAELGLLPVATISALAEIDVLDPEGYGKEYVPKAQA